MQEVPRKHSFQGCSEAIASKFLENLEEMFFFGTDSGECTNRMVHLAIWTHPYEKRVHTVSNLQFDLHLNYCCDIVDVVLPV